jgi:HSP20 family protein
MMYTRVTTAPVFGLRREIDRLFEDTFGHGQVGKNEWSPAVDIRETDKSLTFAVELPGIKLEDLEVTADEGVLTIHGEKSEAWKDGEEGRYHLVERNYGSFTRRFQLPQGVDADKIEADVEGGMLEVRIPKTALPKPKKITVRATDGTRGRTPHVLGTGAPRNGSLKRVVGAN